MPNRDKDPKELIEIAAQQGTHAAKNVAAAASETVSDLLPPSSDGIALAIRVSNKTLIVATAAVSIVATATVVTRIQRERALREKAEKNGAPHVPRQPIEPVVVEPPE
jgi:hypothetical protein